MVLISALFLCVMSDVTWVRTYSVGSPEFIYQEWDSHFTSRDNVQSSTTETGTWITFTNLQRTIIGKHVQGSLVSSPPEWTTNFTPWGTISQTDSTTGTIFVSNDMVARVRQSYDAWTATEDWDKYVNNVWNSTFRRTVVINYNYDVRVISRPAN